MVYSISNLVADYSIHNTDNFAYKYSQLAVIALLISFACSCINTSVLNSEMESIEINEDESTSMRKPDIFSTSYIRNLENEDQYIAFSLRNAKKWLTENDAFSDNNVFKTDIFRLGGINDMSGVVYDTSNNDIIIVGKHICNRSSLTLDDLVIALRSRFVLCEWPLVSIDPAQGLDKVNLQKVRYEGGIAGTQFGADLFKADYTLKQIGLGLIRVNMANFQSFFDLYYSWYVKQPSMDYLPRVRFWFQPVFDGIFIRENVAVLSPLQVAVYSEWEGTGNVYSDDMIKINMNNFADRFSKYISSRYLELCSVEESFSRVQVLQEAVAVAHAIETLGFNPELDYWLTLYPIRSVETPDSVSYLSREKPFEIVNDNILRKNSIFCLEGGVQLTATSIRLREGDPIGLRDAVLESKPRSNSIFWSFLLGNGIIPMTTNTLSDNDQRLLINEAIAFIGRKKYSSAIELSNMIINSNSEDKLALYVRGYSYSQLGKYRYAINDFQQIIRIDDKYSLAYYALGCVNGLIGNRRESLEYLNTSLEINPYISESYLHRACIYEHQGDYEDAITDFNKALSLNPHLWQAKIGRGALLYRLGEYGPALDDARSVLQIEAANVDAYNLIGNIYIQLREYAKSIHELSMAIDIHRDKYILYQTRGKAYLFSEQYEKAICDFDKSLDIYSTNNETHKYRGTAFHMIGEHEKAINDFNKYLDDYPSDIDILKMRGESYYELTEYTNALNDYRYIIDKRPNDVDAFRGEVLSLCGKGMYTYCLRKLNRKISSVGENEELLTIRGIVYLLMLDHEKALSDLNKALLLDINDYEKFYYRSVAHYYLKTDRNALYDCNEAIKLNPKDIESHILRAYIYIRNGNREAACTDFRTACELGECGDYENALRLKECKR